MLTGILILSVFAVMAVLMFLRKLPVLVALPVMSIAIALIGGIPLDQIVTDVVGKGAIRLSEAYTVAMFGGMLSFMLQKNGIAESLIKKGAELSGDNPWKVGFIMLILIVMLFTTLGGLGAIIMVATIVLPILASVGMSPLTSGSLFLIGLSAGGILNAGNWAIYKTVLSLEVVQIRNYATVLFLIMVFFALIFMTIELWRSRQIRSLRKYVYSGTFIVILIGAGYAIFSSFLVSFDEVQIDAFSSIISYVIDAILITIGVAALIHIVSDNVRGYRTKRTSMQIHWYAYLIPIIPLVLILVYQIHFITAFVIALFYGYIATLKKGSLNILTQSAIEGSASVIPAVLLMFGIGMLLNSIIGPSGYSSSNNGIQWPVIGYLQPIISQAIPTTWYGYLFGFTLAAPLALYRGPLNVWGLGYGIAAVMLATGKIPAPLIMVVLLAVGQLQSVCDPTNTQNVWIANELKIDVQQILWRTLPYIWALAFTGLVTGILMFS